MQSVKQTAGISAFILILSMLICTPFSAYSMNSDYVNRTGIWYENQASVVTSPVQTIENYTGFYQYYSDVDEYCFYLHISFSEIELTSESTTNVRFDINNNSREYHFCVDSHGIFDFSEGAAASFNILTSFGNISYQGQEIYIALEFKNKADKAMNNNLSFSITLDGRTYNLCDGILLEYYSEAETKAPKTTTEKQTTIREQNTKESNTKSTTESSTKFKYTGTTNTVGTIASENGFNSEANEYEETLSLPEKSDSDEIITEGNHSSKLSPVSKSLIAVAVVMIITAVALICNVIKHQNKVNQDTDNSETEA